MSEPIHVNALFLGPKSVKLPFLQGNAQLPDGRTTPSGAATSIPTTAPGHGGGGRNETDFLATLQKTGRP
jgi:hypothetical protein